MLNKTRFNISQKVRAYKFRISEFIKPEVKDFSSILQDTVHNINQIKLLGTQMMEIVIRECIQNKKYINIDVNFIRHCFNVVCNNHIIPVRNKKNKKGKVKEKSNEIIQNIYNKYKNIFEIKIKYDKFLTDSIINDIKAFHVCMKTHISTNFLKIQKNNIKICVDDVFKTYIFKKGEVSELTRKIFSQLYEN
jgi:hypothetical protein